MPRRIGPFNVTLVAYRQSKNPAFFHRLPRVHLFIRCSNLTWNECPLVVTLAHAAFLFATDRFLSLQTTLSA